MTNTGILIISACLVLITIIICITNFFCNYYNDYRDEKIKDARKAIKDFEKKHIKYNITRNCDANEEDILELIDNLKLL